MISHRVLQLLMSLHDGDVAHDGDAVQDDDVGSSLAAGTGRALAAREWMRRRVIMVAQNRTCSRTALHKTGCNNGWRVCCMSMTAAN